MNRTRQGDGERAKRCAAFWSWEAAFQKFFESSYFLMNFTSEEDDRDLGVDRKLEFPDGRVVRIQEKCRFDDYRDVFFETFYDHGTWERDGWAVKISPAEVDFLFYAIAPGGEGKEIIDRFYVIPIRHLKNLMPFENYGTERISTRGGGTHSGTYLKTHGIVIPWEKIKERIPQAEEITLSMNDARSWLNGKEGEADDSLVVYARQALREAEENRTPENRLRAHTALNALQSF